jgi:hypothetical protein
MDSNRAIPTDVRNRSHFSNRFQEAQKFAENSSCIFYETSAKTSFNVPDLFETLGTKKVFKK